MFYGYKDRLNWVRTSSPLTENNHSAHVVLQSIKSCKEDYQNLHRIRTEFPWTQSDFVKFLVIGAYTKHYKDCILPTERLDKSEQRRHVLRKNKIKVLLQGNTHSAQLDKQVATQVPWHIFMETCMQILYHRFGKAHPFRAKPDKFFLKLFNISCRDFCQLSILLQGWWWLLATVM